MACFFRLQTIIRRTDEVMSIGFLYISFIYKIVAIVQRPQCANQWCNVDSIWYAHVRLHIKTNKPNIKRHLITDR